MSRGTFAVRQKSKSTDASARGLSFRGQVCRPPTAEVEQVSTAQTVLKDVCVFKSRDER